MNYADIKLCDAANGPGIRISLFVSGCTHRCKGCFNEVAWDFNYGKPFTEKEIDFIIEQLKPSHITGLTILGGEPMEPQNQPGILPLLRKVREVYGDTKTIWIFSGYLFDKDILGRMADTIPETKEILSYIDVMMDGPYVEELKDLSAYFRGSSNQRGILVQESLKSGNLVLWEPDTPKYVFSNT
jgi:anaerobic ribonucleoside-triphosphate reductase activating protein